VLAHREHAGYHGLRDACKQRSKLACTCRPKRRIRAPAGEMGRYDGMHACNINTGAGMACCARGKIARTGGRAQAAEAGWRGQASLCSSQQRAQRELPCWLHNCNAT
jgi:hypothetical protein